MPVTLNNYKQYLLKYLNGNIDQELFNELLDFFAANPDLEKSLIDKDLMNINNSVCFPDKDKLRRNFSDIPEINESNIDEFCIAHLEGLLDDFNRQRFADYLLLHPEKEKNYTLISQTKIKPDLKIIFPDKLLLKKKTSRLKFIHSYYFKIAAVAAAITLIILFNPFRNNINENYNQNYISKDTSSLIKPSELTFQTSVNSPFPDAAVTDKYQTTGLNKHSLVFNNPTPGKDTLPIPQMLASIQPIFLSTSVTSNTLLFQSFKTEPLIVALNDSINTKLKPMPNLQQFVKNLDIRKTPEALVKAFNYLTESNVGLYSNFDNTGKLSGLGIKTELFSFETGKKN